MLATILFLAWDPDAHHVFRGPRCPQLSGSGSDSGSGSGACTHSRSANKAPDVCKVSLLSSTLYAQYIYNLVLFLMQSVLIV